MGDVAGDWIFGFDTNAYLDGRMSDPVHGCVHCQQITHAHRRKKCHRVNRDRHRWTPGVANGAQAPGFIHEFHDDAAMHIAERIGIRGQGLMTQRQLRICRALGRIFWIAAAHIKLA